MKNSSTTNLHVRESKDIRFYTSDNFGWIGIPGCGSIHIYNQATRDKLISELQKMEFPPHA